MKLITNGMVRREKKRLKKAGVSSKNELFDMTVAELIHKVGYFEIDAFLEELVLCSRYEIKEDTRYFPLELVEGHQYVVDIFESNDFMNNPEWFYEITIGEFLELEDLMPNKVPFLTYYLKFYVAFGMMLEPEYVNLYDGKEGKYLFYTNLEEFR